MKILVADDDSIVRAVVKRVVSQFSYDFLPAEDGLEALHLIERDDPDLLVTDLHMPVLDGFELVAAVRGSTLHRAMPIVCLSAESDREAITRLAALGITDYLLKPIRPRDLADRLQAVTSRYGKWKLSRTAGGAEGEAPAVLVIDIDAGFRALAANALSPDYAILEATSGTTGVTLFRAQTRRVAAVLLCEGLELLDEERVAGVLRRLATEQGSPAPAMILVSGSEPVAPTKGVQFDGVIHRTSTAEEFLAAVAQWLPKKDPCPTA